MFTLELYFKGVYLIITDSRIVHQGCSVALVLRASRLHLSVASVLRASRSHLSFASVLWVSRLHLSVASVLQALRLHLLVASILWASRLHLLVASPPGALYINTQMSCQTEQSKTRTYCLFFQQSLYWPLSCLLLIFCIPQLITVIPHNLYYAYSGYLIASESSINIILTI